MRHSMVNEVLSRALCSAGCPTILEPQHIAENVRPDGITKIPFKGGLSLAYDVTHPHPLCAAYSHISHKQCSVANSAETKKTAKYVQLLPKYHFVPFAIETLGAYGDQADELTKEIGRRIYARTGEKKATSYLRQRLSLAVQRGNALTMKFSF